MRIAILGTRGIPANYGGFETFAEELSKRLFARGHKVAVYCRSSKLETWFKDSKINGIVARIVPTVFHKYFETIVHTVFSFMDCCADEFDAILLCNAANSPFIPIAQIRGIPVAVNVDGIERKRSKWNSFGRIWYRLGECSSVLFADRIVADAEVISKYYARTYGVKSDVIAYGADRLFEPTGAMHQSWNLIPKQYLLYVSRLEPENNALGVVEAYVQSSISMPLVIVGDAPYAEGYKKKLLEAACALTAQAQAAGARVVFTGFQFGPAYRELREHCYLYIQATEVGGTHPALVEAMAHANCILANDVPEHREVLADSGVFYPFNDFKTLAKQIAELTSNPGLVTELGFQALNRAKQYYSWDIITSKYEQLFLELDHSANPSESLSDSCSD